jgi:hypothetical protein
MVKIGINGFGRIGRMVFRAAVKNFSKDIQIVGINDLLDPEYLAYMLTYDSVHGKFEGDVKVEGTNLIVNGNKIRLTAVKDPSTLKWDEVGADIVVESTGLFLDKATAEAHLKAGAKKVIMSAPSKDETPMFVYGVNHTSYAGEAIISNASCTTNCLAPLAKVSIVTNNTDRVATLPTPGSVRILLRCNEESTAVNCATDPTVEPSHRGRAKKMLPNTPVLIFDISHGFPAPKRQNLSAVVSYLFQCNPF